MKTWTLIILINSSIAFAYEVYDPGSGGTFYVKWCDPVKDEINKIQYIQCGDSSDKKIAISGACSNLQSDCGQTPLTYPVQNGDPKHRDLVKVKKQWEYFNLKQAAQVGYPGTYKPASSEATASDKKKPMLNSPATEKAIKKP